MSGDDRDNSIVAPGPDILAALGSRVAAGSSATLILEGRGLAADQMSPKAYWGRGRANASHGEPARDG